MIQISEIIKQAKLGRARKEAQTDTCTVFAAALYDLLQAQQIPCSMACVQSVHGAPWAHLLVEVDGKFYDSMGEFSTEIYRVRAKIHPTVTVQLKFTKDFREECYDPEFDDLYLFYLKKIEQALTAYVDCNKKSDPVAAC
ncbi:hypothetical protein [Giesbergeria anulus]|uniref:Uncharacterized protein n=1 Tax=Giesbergeria anulus TaxID=180197 RepID=A0A1H9NSS7_9BURK|nr:hypothetical protein [Giesbergeria anulus]SER38679.1 hypothetical protein SAMN02982919_02320 [Giesbergeria anulus]